MRTAKIRQVKKEIRVLGIAVKPSRGGDGLHAIGVVFRGKLWLDGVMRTTARGPDLTESLVEMITRSPHHPQIRVILLHDALMAGGAAIDPYRLSTGTSRPVLLLSAEETWPEAPEGATAQRFRLRRAGDSVAVLSVGLGSRVAARVLEVSTREGAMPEALRVAGLVAEAVAGGLRQNV